MAERYTKQHLDQARELAHELSTKRIERIALALAEAERKGEDRLRAVLGVELAPLEVEHG